MNTESEQTSSPSQPPYSTGQKQTATTVFAIIILVIGGIGFIASSFNFVLVLIGPQNVATSKIPFATTLIDAILQLVCKIGFLSIGMMMIKRNILAIRVAVVTFLVSLASTAYTAFVIAPYMIETIGRGQPGIVYAGIGFFAILSVGMYVGIIVYLNAEKTRNEFINYQPGYRF